LRFALKLDQEAQILLLLHFYQLCLHLLFFWGAKVSNPKKIHCQNTVYSEPPASDEREALSFALLASIAGYAHDF
jgi:hypothetical protein